MANFQTEFRQHVGSTEPCLSGLPYRMPKGFQSAAEMVMAAADWVREMVKRSLIQSHIYVSDMLMAALFL